MPETVVEIRARILSAAADMPAADWNACAGHDNPFVSHEFFTSLESFRQRLCPHRLAPDAYRHR